MTILDSELSSLEGVDKAYHPLYTERDGKWLLTGVKGYTPEDREKTAGALKRERENASTYANEAKALRPWKTLFGDKKPEDIQAQLERIEELELAAKGKLDESELEKRVAARLDAAKRPFQRQLDEASQKLTAAEQRIQAYERAEERAAIRAEIQRAASASGALPDAYAEGGGLLAVLEGALEVEVEVDSEGRRKLGAVRSRDGAGYPSGLDVGKLLQQVQTKQGYFWGPSKGGGARPGEPGARGGGSGTQTQNPWKPGLVR